MSVTILEALNLSDEFMNEKVCLCGLCGNTGVIDTIGKVKSPAGIECGIRAHCICANGRAMKRSGTKQLWNVLSRPPKTFWVSWDDYSWKTPSKKPPTVLDSWESGQAGDGSYATLVAWLMVISVDEAIEVVHKVWPGPGERRWRFIKPCPHGFRPNSRFPLSARGRKLVKQYSHRIDHPSPLLSPDYTP